MTRRRVLPVPVRGGVAPLRVVVDEPAGDADGGEPPAAWLQHGFARRPGHLDGLAAALAGAGLRVVRPALASLSPRRSVLDAGYLTAVALTVATALPRGTPRIAVLGHSAGAAVATHVAGVLAERPGPPVAGAVLIDPVDTIGHLLAASLPALTELGDRVAVAALRPSRCNRHGAGAALIARGCPAAGHRAWPDLGHADPERIPGDLAVDDIAPAGLAVRIACGPPGPAADIAALGAWIVGTARRLAFTEAAA